jgi:hypothetical protein
MLDSWARKSRAAVTCICAGIVGALLLMVWVTSTSAAPQAPGAEPGPAHTHQLNAGRTEVKNNETVTVSSVEAIIALYSSFGQP